MNKTNDTTLFAQHPALTNLVRVLTICKGFALYFASCNTVALRESLVDILKAKLNRPILELALEPENSLSIAAQAEALIQQADESAVVFIYGLETLYHLKDHHIMQELQWHRERYGRLKRPLVFWMPDFLITEIFHEAPDFMDWRSGIYEFSLPRQDKQILAHNTWQSVNETFDGQLTLEEKKRWIVSLENLLAELGDENSQSRRDLLNRLGLLYDSIGNYDQALLCYQQNLPLCQALGDKANEGATLNNISQIYRVKGDYDRSLTYLTDALKIQQAIGDIKGEGATLNNLATIAYTKGDYDTSLTYFKDALKIQQAIGNKQVEGVTLNNISSCYHAKGNYDTSLTYLENALKIAQAIGDKQGESTILLNLGYLDEAKKK